MRIAVRLVVGVVAVLAALGFAPAAASATSLSPCGPDHIGVYGEVGGNYFTVCVQKPRKD